MTKGNAPTPPFPLDYHILCYSVVFRNYPERIHHTLQSPTSMLLGQQRPGVRGKSKASAPFMMRGMGTILIGKEILPESAHPYSQRIRKRSKGSLTNKAPMGIEAKHRQTKGNQECYL